MEDVIGALGGFRGVRSDLLVALRKYQPQTAQELGARFGLTANALRRHLHMLEGDGLVFHAREVRGVGAPVFGYALTEAGEALFPRRYLNLLASALDVARKHGGEEAVHEALAVEWSALADEAAPLLDGLPIEERVPLVAELMSSKGYMAEVVHVPSPDGDSTLTLRIHNCAMREIADRFPEACAAEAHFVERLLGVPLARGAHRLQGCSRCDYGVGS